MKYLFLVLFSLCLACTPACAPEIEQQQEEEDTYPQWECNNDIGEHPCDFTLKNQHGENVSLYDFIGEYVVLDFSVMWCGPCQSAASDITNTVQKFPEINYITVLIDNEVGEEPTESDLERWAENFEISEPVLGGSRDLIQSTDPDSYPVTSWPTFFYIDDEMILKFFHPGYSSATLELNIDTLLSE